MQICRSFFLLVQSVCEMCNGIILLLWIDWVMTTRCTELARLDKTHYKLHCPPGLSRRTVKSGTVGANSKTVCRINGIMWRKTQVSIEAYYWAIDDEGLIQCPHDTSSALVDTHWRSPWMYGFGGVGGLDQRTKFLSFLGRYNNGFMQNSYALTKVIFDNEKQCQIIQLEPAN